MDGDAVQINQCVPRYQDTCICLWHILVNHGRATTNVVPPALQPYLACRPLFEWYHFDVGRSLFASFSLVIVGPRRLVS